MARKAEEAADNRVECKITAECAFPVSGAVARTIASHVRGYVRNATKGYTEVALNAIEDVCMGYYL